jgi:hypothetical protein
MSHQAALHENLQPLVLLIVLRRRTAPPRVEPRVETWSSLHIVATGHAFSVSMNANLAGSPRCSTPRLFRRMSRSVRTGCHPATTKPDGFPEVSTPRVWERRAHRSLCGTNLHVSRGAAVLGVGHDCAGQSAVKVAGLEHASFLLDEGGIDL